MQDKWIDIFALAQYNAGLVKVPYGGRTVRIIIKNYLEGDCIRVTLANRYGKKGIEVGSVTAAACDKDGKLLSKPVSLTFNSEKNGIISPFSTLRSDDIKCSINPGYIAISIFYKSGSYINSLNMLREKVIVSNKGDFTYKEEVLNVTRTSEKIVNLVAKISKMKPVDLMPSLECVSISTVKNIASVLAFGDSITQGGKWSYELADRLNLPVINLGISGNRLLRDSHLPIVHGLFGEAGIKRFDRDVLTRAGAKVIIVALGTNDIGQPGALPMSKSEKVTSIELIAGLKALANRAKAAGLVPYVATITPFKYFRMGYIGDAYEVRQEVNDWIRNNTYYAGYFDFDKMIMDEKEPEMIAKPYDSGDHLHPSDEGSVRLADAIDIDKLYALLTN